MYGTPLLVTPYSSAAEVDVRIFICVLSFFLACANATSDDRVRIENQRAGEEVRRVVAAQAFKFSQPCFIFFLALLCDSLSYFAALCAKT